jgi:hypothetical protein
LVGATGATGATGSTGATGASGANGSSVLNGTGAPTTAIGADGDFYLDISTYMIYGPKAAGTWGPGVSLKAPAGGNGSNVTAFETADDTFLFWAVNFGTGPVSTTGPPTSFVLRQQKASGDTSGVFRLPDSLAGAVNNGVVLVYLHLLSRSSTDVSKWIQLSYTNVAGTKNYQYYNYKAITNPAGVVIQITADVNNTSEFSSPVLDIDKVRIVVVPHTVTGTLGVKKSQPSLTATMQQLHLTDKNFIKIK